MTEFEQSLGQNMTSLTQPEATRYAEQNPDNVDAWRALARISAQLGDIDSVERACRQIIRLQPDATAWLNLGITCQSQGRLADAANAYRQTLEYSPAHAGALVNLCRICLAQGDPDNARRHLEQIPPDHPHHASICHELGMTLMRQRRIQDALQCLTDLHARVPDHPGIHISLTYAWHFAGDKAKAEDAFQRSRALYEQDPRKFAELAALAAELGDMASAITLYKKAIAAGDNRELTLYSLGYALFCERYYRDAIPHLEQVVKANPANASAAFCIAQCYEQLADSATAKTFYLKALEQHEDKALVSCRLGMLDLHCKKHSSAMEYFRKALEHDENSSQAYLGIGMVKLEQGSLDEARANVQKAKTLAPENTGISNLLSCISQQESASADENYLNYVAQLFDSCADSFDEALVDGLEYKVPEHIYQAVSDVLGTAPAAVDILDLGCGTGLCGMKVKHCADALVGVDISPQMIEKSRARNIYTDLEVSALDSYLASARQAFDLIISGDVFVYFSDLREVFEGCRRVLRPGGYFVFSIACSENNDIQLEASGRFFHSPRYIDGLADLTGFDHVFGRSTVLRKEFGQGVKGMIYALRKPEA